QNLSAIGQLDIRAVQPAQCRRSSALSRAMAADAVVFDEEFCARFHRLHVVFPGEPRLILTLPHDDDAANHFGMVGSAVFGAEQVVCAGTCGLEPERAIFAWNGVLLHSKSGEVKAVDYILRRERQLDGRFLVHMQFVDFAPAFWMLFLSLPL